MANPYGYAEVYAPTPLTRAELTRSGLSVVDAGWIRSESGFQMGPRVVEMYDFVLVLEGAARFWSDVHEFTVGRGNLVLLFPLVRHAFMGQPQRPFKIAYASFSGRDAADIVERDLRLTVDRPVVDLGEHADILADSIGELTHTMLCDPRSRATLWQSRAHLWKILGFILEILEERTVGPERPPSSAVITLLNLFETQYHREWTLPQLAQLVHLSPSRLFALFKQHTGSSPHAFLTKVRLDRSVALLATSDLSVAEVATSVGFRDPAYFSRVFRQHFGTPPSVFRSQGKR